MQGQTENQSRTIFWNRVNSGSEDSIAERVVGLPQFARTLRRRNVSTATLVVVSSLFGAAVAILCIVAAAVVDPHSPVSYVLSLDRGESVYSALKKEIDRVSDLEARMNQREEQIRLALSGIRELAPQSVKFGADHSTGLGGGAEVREVPIEDRLKAIGSRNKKRLSKISASAHPSIGRASLTEILTRAPLGAPVSSGVSSGFGLRASPFSKQVQLHQGIDFDARDREPIYSTGEGVVRQAGYRGSYGYSVIVDHGYGIESLYAHLSKISVRVGDKVSRGDKIGNVGSTGQSTGPHLHYEVRLNGLPKNPLRLVQIASALRALI